ncbi:DNA repair protein RecO [Candidatus Kaiserbacteria bacterium CG10_big_fil_rev_8_21_14_0_10_49_17]|uniref:DNA repair protein RecO n=1 Tax=Candidatus Kaiserbacteria bacterium CG10_big_fil_rev_8_21_14_0_10_49_17 TaxID=1974609 RepID=A0A2M6WDN0_9BACT|nr:MAG: DNA repair protein RecO [Candidatus Kaiserbacteria bacterium CG10_big_fil_rev_8_21_14_0_10_49_17]
MAYRQYESKGLVLSGSDVGEQERLVELFTCELGLIRAIARGVRRENSKLRYGLTDFTVGTFSFVRGKELWRLTGAVAESNAYRELERMPERQDALARIVSLVRRLVPGEETNQELFDILLGAIAYLCSEAYTGERDDRFEIVTVLRILHTLGYVAKEAPYGTLLDSAELSESVVADVTNIRKEMVEAINTSLRESQL